MAQRRMFTQKITESDSFTTLPPTTQCLYFHLCMSADDDGFSNKIRQAMFNAHADQNDFEMLVQKRFILPFDSGVIVIKHWRMHNLIRSDRYHETDYVEEKASLILKENGVYTDVPPCGIPCDNQMATNGIPSDNQMEPEVRLGKVRLGYKESKEKPVENQGQLRTNKLNTKDKKKKPRVLKESYGELGNVKLTNDEYNRLVKDYGEALTLKAIEYLDGYIADKKYKSSDNNRAMRRWVFDAVREQEQKRARLNSSNNKNSFMQNTYDFDALEAELRAN